MRFRRPIVTGVLALAVSTATSAQTSQLDDVLTNARRYVAGWVPQLANIVAIEDYEQRMTPQAQKQRTLRLKSDVLLVSYPAAEADWMFFRDVTMADNQAIGTNQDRMVYLFANRGAAAAERAGRISNEALRYNLPGATFAATNPLVAAALMQSYYQPRLRFTLAEIDRTVGPTARIVRFEEIEEVRKTGDQLTSPQQLPVLLGAAGRVKGSIWVDTTNGRILKTEARMGEGALRSTTTTTFERDERLGIMVPKEMRTTWRHDNTPVNGTARYANFRRFQVTADTPVVELPQ